MNKRKPFVTQVVIVGGFLTFLYIFFALATAIYRDYKLELNIEKFEKEIDQLAEMANQKPKNVKYYESVEFKDKYAKESLNLLNPGEKLIIIPSEDKIVKSETIVERNKNKDILKLPNRNQWWEYYFGRTLSLQVEKKKAGSGVNPNPTEDPSLDQNSDEESALGTEG